MLATLMMALMLSLAAYYSSAKSEAGAVAAEVRSAGAAAEMALYRAAVVAHFSLPANAAVVGASVAPTTLVGEGLLPSWSPLGASGGAAAWGNYRMGDGTIVVYAVAPPPGLFNDLLALSGRSAMVGSFSAADNRFHSRLSDLPTTIVRPLAAIAHGAPVWIAQRN